MTHCPYCGMIHQMTCPRIKAIEYNADGSTRRVEFHSPAPVVGQPQMGNLRVILDGPSSIR